MIGKFLFVVLGVLGGKYSCQFVIFNSCSFVVKKIISYLKYFHRFCHPFPVIVTRHTMKAQISGKCSLTKNKTK